MPFNWTDYLKSEADDTYKAAFGLIDLVDDDKLDWKPPTGENWMTLGQLLAHLPGACGFCFKGFVTGEWGMPEGQKMEEVPDEEMLPPAAKLPSVSSVAEAREKLQADQKVCHEMIGKAGEDRLTNEKSAPPWGGSERALGHHLSHMVQHLAIHKAQLFYYLKLLGKPVHTGSMWGM